MTQQLTVTMSPEPRLFFDWLFWWRTGSVEPGNRCSATAMGGDVTISANKHWHPPPK